MFVALLVILAFAGGAAVVYVLMDDPRRRSQAQLSRLTQERVDLRDAHEKQVEALHARAQSLKKAAAVHDELVRRTNYDLAVRTRDEEEQLARRFSELADSHERRVRQADAALAARTRDAEIRIQHLAEGHERRVCEADLALAARAHELVVRAQEVTAAAAEQELQEKQSRERLAWDRKEFERRAAELRLRSAEHESRVVAYNELAAESRLIKADLLNMALRLKGRLEIRH